MARILIIVLAFALLGGALQAPDLAGPSSALVDDGDDSTAVDLPVAVVIPSPQRRLLTTPAHELLVPLPRFGDSIFRPPRAVTFG
ncbi:MAG: hypothetical protein JWO36_1214 [Myxococcales bacterium]|nr:hypothetical protein [Myxococcales bacterium]